MRECDANFQDEMLNFSKDCGRRHFLRIDNYRDNMHNNTWDVSAWIRVYSTYLDERLDVYRCLGYDVDAPSDLGSVNEKLVEKSTPELLSILGSLQTMVEALIACLPEGEAAAHDATIAAAILVAKEAGNAYMAAHEALLLVAERVLELTNPTDATMGLDLLKKGIDLHNRISAYKIHIEGQRDIARGVSIAQPPLPPSEAVRMVEEHVAGLTKASARQSKAVSVPVLAKMANKKPVSYAKVEVHVPGIFKTSTELNLLVDLDVTSSAASSKSTCQAQVTTPLKNNPFGGSDPFSDTTSGPVLAADPFGTPNHAFGSDLFAMPPAPRSVQHDTFAVPASPPPASDISSVSALSTPATSNMGSFPPTPTPTSGVHGKASTLMDDMFGPSMPIAAEPPTTGLFYFGDLQLPHVEQPNTVGMIHASVNPQPFGMSQGTNNPFSSNGLTGSKMNGTNYHAPPQAVSNMFSSPSPGRRELLNGSALTAAGLSPTMLASEMAKTSVHDPFAELTSPYKPVAPTSSGCTKLMRA